MNSRTVKGLSALVVIASIVLGTASPALAHDPIFMTNDQTTPDTGPFMPDGSISWALYGSVLSDGDTRGFEFDLREGDEVFVSLLIPNLSPEVDLGDGELPIIELEAPDGTVTTIAPVVRDVFDEPFSRTSYVTLAEHREPAQAGRYRGLVIGNAPSRFSVAIGETEIFFTETERSGDRPSSFAEITEPLTAWYTTPPGGEADATTLEAGAAEIDLDLIDDAMASGEVDAAGASGDPGEAAAQEVDEAGLADDGEQAQEVDGAGLAGDGEQARESDEAGDPPAADGTGDRAASAGASTEPAESSTTWVAPFVIAAIALLGAGVYFARRGAGA